MADGKTVKERIRELEIEFAESIKEAQSQPGLKEMEIVYGREVSRKGSEADVVGHVDP